MTLNQLSRRRARHRRSRAEHLARRHPVRPDVAVANPGVVDPGTLPIRAAMTAYPDALPPWLTAASILDRHPRLQRHDLLPLTERGLPVGVVTLARIRAVPVGDRATVCLRQLAEPPGTAAVAHLDEPLATVLPRIARSRHRTGLVVSSGGILVGIVGPAEIDRLDRLLTALGPAVAATITDPLRAA